MKSNRIDVANEVLEYFASDTKLSFSGNYIVVSWKDYNGNPISRRWMTRGTDFYPVWNSKWCYGGTSSMALSQLVRWCQGKPVVPISTWKHWCGKSVGLARGMGDQVVKTLQDGGYPETATCVLCGRELNGFDWWNLNGASGPCCHHTEGCRQK